MSKLWDKLVNKFKKHSSWMKDYLVEISIVVISIAITFYGDSLIDDYNNKQDDIEMMDMVRLELEDNKEELTKIMVYYQKDLQMSTAFKSYAAGQGTTEADSLQKYYNQHRSYGFWFLKNNAFDILRVSGTVQRIDKPLLMSLLEIYEQIDVVRNLDERYMGQKRDHILNYRYNLPNDKDGETTLEQWGNIDRNAEFKKFISISMPSFLRNVMQASQRALDLINDSIIEIEDQYP